MNKMRVRAGCGFSGPAIIAGSLVLGLLATGAGAQQRVVADDATRSPLPRRAQFELEHASRDARHVADWVVDASDNHAGDGRILPFIIVDKKEAKVFVFDADGQLRGAAPALLGLGRGDTAPPGIGDRALSHIPPKDRTTPAGRFVAALGIDSHGEDILWIDYEGAVAMHRVITTNPKERRLQRLATPTPLDNRISFGCINIPVKFYENVVRQAFTGTYGIVYVLPETRPAREVFAMYDFIEQPHSQIAHPSVRRPAATKAD